MPETDRARMARLELDPRIVSQIRAVRDRVAEAMARLAMLEQEIDAYLQEDK